MSIHGSLGQKLLSLFDVNWSSKSYLMLIEDLKIIEKTKIPKILMFKVIDVPLPDAY